MGPDSKLIRFGFKSELWFVAKGARWNVSISSLRSGPSDLTTRLFWRNTRQSNRSITDGMTTKGGLLVAGGSLGKKPGCNHSSGGLA